MSPERWSEKWTSWDEFEVEVIRRTQELTKNQSTYFNVASTMELVRNALAMGYELKRID